ncbi:polysaccharide deacetylase family protein [Streptomyces virginiae]|uniref:polysaccharide deacetylase family protein n=1 Tax=Streptomyces virginiae TaxID=1961 RepID=UPI00224F43A6|nr:polysaccharide deacetylase family protein [Streptomyces virginiae]MCX4960211.1 polysaccharide deacetylase family protein [Streptomyces virginiae]
MSKNRRRRSRGRHSSVRNIPLRTHWLLLTTLVLTLSAALLLQGYTQHLFDSTPDGAPRERGSGTSVPAGISSGGPVIEGAAGRTAAPAARTLALTFDDGPDPVWTPKILDVLRRNDVPATFFTVGTRVAENPDLARRIVDEGHQIGLHSFTHTDLGTAAPRPPGGVPWNCARPSSSSLAPPASPRHCCARRTPPPTRRSATPTGVPSSKPGRRGT